jgi:beta-glucosidase
VYVEVCNTGARPGREVVQVYLSRQDTAVERPVRWLAGYAAVTAAPGETVRAAVEVAPRAVAHWSTDAGDWAVEQGTFDVLAGRTAGDVPLRGSVTVVES